MFSSYTSPRVGTKSFSLVQNAFLQADDLPFRDVLTEEEIDAAFVAENACFGEDEDDIYTPALTLVGMVVAGDACGEGAVLRGGRGAHHGVVRGLGPQAAVAGHGGLLPRTGEAARARAAAAGLHRGRRTGVARAGRLAVAGPAREDRRRHDAADPRHGRQPGGVAPGTHAEARPGVSHPADGGAFVLGHGRLVRAGDRTVQGQGDGRAGLVARVAGPLPARRRLPGRLLLTARTSCWRCCWAGAWTW